MNSKRYDGIDHPVREVTDLKDIIYSSCEMFADVDAYLYKDKEAGKFVGIKYSQVKADVDALGTRFLDMGLKDKKIAVIGETSYYWFLTYYATVCGTGVIVPLDKNLPADEVVTLIKRSGAAAIIYSNKMGKSVKALFDDPGTIEYFISMDEPRHKALAADSDPTNDRGGSGAAANRIMSMRALIAEGADLVHQGERNFIDAKVDPDAMAALLFTSGTTGKAKGVMLSHKNIASNVVNMSRREKLGDNFIILSILPTHHTFENTCVDWTTFYQGKTLAICEGVKYISKNMNEVHANCMVGVPLVFEKIYKGMMKQAESSGQGEKLRNAIELSRRLKLYNNPLIMKRMFKAIHEALGGEMKQFIAGGAAIDPQVIKDFEAMGIPMMQGYGMTECSPIIAVNQNNYSIAESVGRPMHGTTVKIDNPDTDGIGEIVVKSPSVMLGYYEDPEATAEVLRDGWLYTGDLGYMDENGFLYVTGRKKTVIVTKGGKNIFPEEIEEVLKQNDLIKEVLVHGVTDKRIGNVAITADIQPNFVLLKERYGEMDSSDIYHFYKELVDKVNDTMPPYKAIKRVNIREKDFEMTTTGKIKRYGNFVEGEDATGSLSYREIKAEESQRIQELIQEIKSSDDPAYINKDLFPAQSKEPGKDESKEPGKLLPVTDLRELIRFCAEKYGDEIAFRNTGISLEDVLMPEEADVQAEKSAAASGTDVTFKQFLADVNGLGTSLINRGFKGKKVKIKCEGGKLDYENLVLFFAVACGLGTVLITEGKPDSTIRGFIDEGKNQLALGDRQYIDTEILGSDSVLESFNHNEEDGITFTHYNFCESLIATALMLESPGMNGPYYALPGRLPVDESENGEINTTEFLLGTLLPLYMGCGVDMSLSEESLESSRHKTGFQYFGLPESVAPIAIYIKPSKRFLPEIPIPGLMSKGERKIRTAMKSGAAGHITPCMGIKFIDKDLSGNGEICLAGGSLGILNHTSQGRDAFEWLNTGLLGHMDDAGFLYITGKVTDRFTGDKRA